METKRYRVEQLKQNKIFEFRYKSEQDDYCLLESIKKYGQLRPILITQDFEIIDGNKLYNILLSLGVDSIQWKVIHTSTDLDYIKLRLELNCWSKRLDPIPLYKKLEEVKDSISTLNIPFPKKDLLGWIEMLNWDWSIYKSDKTQSDTLW